MSDTPCVLCGRLVPELTAHHLIPKSQHQRIRKRTGATREELGSRTVDVCPPCHKMIHRTLSEKELATTYETIAKLRAQPELAKFVAWVRGQPAHKQITIR